MTTVASLTKELIRAQGKVVYWSARTGLLARFWLAYWRRKVDYILGIIGSTPPAPPSVTTPTAPVLGTPTVASSVISVPITTPSTHPNGIGGYEVWRGTSSGSEVLVGTTTVFTYVSPGLAAGTYYFKFKGYPVSDSTNVSAFSNEVSATITGSLAADSTAPLASVQPSIESGGTTTLPSVAVITPPADSSVNAATQVVAGGDYVRWYQSINDGAYTHDSAKDSYYPEAAAESLQDIGAAKTGSGSDDGSTLTSVGVSSGEAIYGTSDKGFTYKSGSTKGKVTMFIKPTLATAAISNFGYEKPIGLLVRATNDPASAYIDIGLFNAAAGGAKAIFCEYRDTSGADAAQITAIPYTTYPWLKLVYDPDTQVAVASTSTDSTNGTDGTWTVRLTRSMPNIGRNYLSGKFGANAGTATYTNYSRTVDTQVRYAFTGAQVVGSVTTYDIKHDAVDKAGNPNTAGTARRFSYDALSSGGGGGSGHSKTGFYGIGGSNRLGSLGIAALARKHRVVLTIDDSYTTTEAAVVAINANCVLIPYLDTTRLSTAGIQSRALAADMVLKNGDGSYAYFGGSGGDSYGITYTLNYGAYSTAWSPPKRDSNGRDVAQMEAAYRFDYWRKGGANGIASDAKAANTNSKGSYADDWLTNPPFAGLFTPGNTDAAYWMTKGFIAMVDALRALYVADGVAAPVIGANSSKWYQNADAVMSIILPVAAGKIDEPVQEHIGSVLGGNWFGTGGFLDRFNSYCNTLVTATGHGLFDCDIDPPGYSDRSRQIRYMSTACFVTSNWLFSPKVNPETYYRDWVDTFVYAKCFDVNTSTGVGIAEASAGLEFAWLGAAASGSTGAPQTTADAHGIMAREYANAWVVVRPTDGGGDGRWDNPVQVKRINCDDDATQDGTVFPAHSMIEIPATDGQYFLIWP